MVQRPPFDRNNPPPPGGFDPRFGGERGYDRRPDRQFDQEGGFNDRGDRHFGGRPDPRRGEPDPFERRAAPLRRGDDDGVRRGGPNRWLWIIGGLVLLGAILFGLSLTRSGPGADAISSADDEGSEETVATSSPEARCAAPATYDLIKRELFRQAAATRGSAQATYAQLPSYATLRITNPVLRERDEGLERVSCTGSAALDLPPGVAVVGGRRTLTANIGYNLQPAADGSGEVVTLTGAEGITVPLATLARIGEAGTGQPDSAPAPNVAQAPTVEDPSALSASPPPPSEATRSADAAPDQGPPPPAAIPPSAGVRPSFNCARARTRGEIAVCNSPELAALDRQMAGFYGTSYRGADAEARALLERTRSRFLTFRDRCRSDSCVADAYRGRITEIRDIVDGRWRAPN